MIPSSSALVSLKPARQAALQAIMTVEGSLASAAHVCHRCHTSGHSCAC